MTLIPAVILAAAAVWAAEPAPAPKKDPAAKFETAKAKRLERLDGRIAEMQKQRACVVAAADMAALRQCRPDRDDVDPAMRACVQACRGKAPAKP
jgi:hypothetical protein